MLLLAACSSPKYTYHFDRYDYNSGRKQKAQAQEVVAANEAETEALASEVEMLPVVASSSDESPLLIKEPQLVASANATPMSNAEAQSSFDAEAFGKAYGDMSRSERKEFRKNLKAEIKNAVKEIKKGKKMSEIVDGKAAMDNDLKLAIIFGAIGLVLSLFGGANSVFWVLSVVAVVIAVVFFIKWLVRQ